MSERTDIANYLRRVASKLLIEAMEQDQYNLERAELLATVLEESADAIERGEDAI